jgi:hypothetical protein
MVDAEDRDPSDPYDEIHLTNGTSYVTITGNPDFGADQLRRCVDDYAALREQTEGVTALDAVPGTRGQDDGRAFAAYSLSYQSEDYVDYIECRDLGNVTLVVFHNVAADAYQEEIAARENLLAGLTSAEPETAD